MLGIPFYKQFRFKLTVAYILFITVIIAATGIFSFQASEEQFNHLLLREFQSSRSVAVNFLKFVEQTALIAAKSSASDRELQSIILSEDKEQLAARLEVLMNKNSADALTLLNHKGVVIARGHDRNVSGDSLRSFDIVHDVINGKDESTAIVQDLGSLILYVAAVVHVPNIDTPFYILAGYGLNNNFVDNIQENSQIEVSIVRERSVISTTLRSQGKRITTLPIPFLEYELLLSSPDTIRSIHFLGEDYYISALRLPFMQENMAGSMFLVHSQCELDEVRKRLSMRFAVIFVTSLVAGILVIFFFTGAMIRPVHQLIQTTNQISTGQLQSRCRIDSNDELGLLSNHFNLMADAVQERDSALREHSENLEQEVKARTAEVVEQSVLINNVLRSSTVLAIAIVDTDLRIKRFNSVAEEIFGYKAEDVLGHTVFEIHAMENVESERLEKALEIVRQQGYYCYNVEQERAGKKQFIESTVTAIIDEQEILKGFVLMSQDVTRRKQMEQDVQESKKFEAFAVLAGGLAHDFNNLLQVILGGVSFVQKMTSENTDVASMLDNVNEAASQAAKLSHAMLILSRGGYQTTEPCNIFPLLEKEGNEVASETVTCVTDMAEALWPIEGNMELLTWAIHNVVVNGVDAMSSEGGTLTITAQNRAAGIDIDQPLADQNRIAIMIQDTGVGISQRNVNKIFDPYFSTQERGSQKGMGLGLAITLAIIKKHAGDITVQSSPGAGTSITLFLPALDAGSAGVS